MYGRVDLRAWRPEVLLIRGVACTALVAVLIRITMIGSLSSQRYLVIGWVLLSVCLLSNLGYVTVTRFSQKLLHTWTLGRQRKAIKGLIRLSEEMKSASLARRFAFTERAREEFSAGLSEDNVYRFLVHKTVVIVETDQDNPLPMLFLAESLKKVGLNVHLVPEHGVFYPISPKGKRRVYIAVRESFRTTSTHILAQEEAEEYVSVVGLARGFSRLIDDRDPTDARLWRNLNHYLQRVAKEVLALFQSPPSAASSGGIFVDAENEFPEFDRKFRHE